MSILINGMQLPKDEVAVIIYSDGDVRTEDWTKYSSIEVPPHGDLIDRDKLREKEFIHDGDAYAVVMSRDIRNAPTVIPADKGGET